MALQFKSQLITDRRIINALKRRQFSENSFCNLAQQARFCQVQQYYIVHNNRQFIVVEHCGRNFFVKGLTLFVYEFESADFSIIEFEQTNFFKVHSPDNFENSLERMLEFRTE